MYFGRREIKPTLLRDEENKTPQVDRGVKSHTLVRDVCDLIAISTFKSLM